MTGCLLVHCIEYLLDVTPHYAAYCAAPVDEDADSYLSMVLSKCGWCYAPTGLGESLDTCIFSFSFSVVSLR